jgi:hypothetical protein
MVTLAVVERALTLDFCYQRGVIAS